MSKRLEELDKEEEKLCDELFASTESMSLERLLGFKLPENKCFLPPTQCGMTLSPITSLIPLYELLILPVYSEYLPPPEHERTRISNVKIFKVVHGLDPAELAALADRGRVLPYFAEGFAAYDEEVIAPLLKMGVPKISAVQMSAIRTAPIQFRMEEKAWKDMHSLADQNVKNLNFPKGQTCANCLSVCYMLGLKDYFHANKDGWAAACFVTYALASEILGGFLQTECRLAREVLSSIGSLPERVSTKDIIEGLKVNYSPDIPLETYAEVFDGKTSKALRKIVGDLLNDPLAKKYAERLNSKVFDLNKQVEELAESKTSKVFEAISNMTVYGGSKFIESQTQGYVKVPKKGLIKLAEWLASKGVDLQARMTGKDWSIAQLYKARCRLRECKEKS